MIEATNDDLRAMTVSVALPIIMIHGSPRACGQRTTRVVFQSTMVRAASGFRGTMVAGVALRSAMIGGAHRARGRHADGAMLHSTMMQGAGGGRGSMTIEDIWRITGVHCTIVHRRGRYHGRCWARSKAGAGGGALTVKAGRVDD